MARTLKALDHGRRGAHRQNPEGRHHQAEDSTRDEQADPLAALHHAAEQGSVGVTKLLLGAGADPDFRNNMGFSPSDVATLKARVAGEHPLFFSFFPPSSFFLLLSFSLSQFCSFSSPPLCSFFFLLFFSFLFVCFWASVL